MSDVEEVDAAKEERLKEIWKDDKLGRRADADYLIRFLTRRIEERGEQRKEKSYVLNIDSQWGGGKTFFLDRLGDHLEEENYLVARVNAWEDDHAEDPLLAVMAALDGTLKAHLSEDIETQATRKEVLKNAGRVVLAFGKGALQQSLRKVVGESMAEVAQLLTEGQPENSMELEKSLTGGLEAAAKKLSKPEKDPTKFFDDFLAEKEMIKLFKGDLKRLLGEPEADEVSSKFIDERKAPLFVLVDEMDRCRPPYAIALLERVKHLFDIDNVIFIFATDTKQLSHSIKVVYGGGFDSPRYLHRFFDQTYRFFEPPFEDFVTNLLETKSISTTVLQTPRSMELAEFCIECFRDFQLSLRDIEQCIDILHNVITGWNNDSVPIQAVVMLPLLVALHKGKDIYQPWGEELIQEIETGATRGRVPGWSAVFPTGEYDGSNVAIESVSCWHLLRRYIELALLDARAFRHAQKSIQSMSRWEESVYLYIEREYRGLERDSPANKLKLRQYPAIIASAGRLGKV